MAILAAHMDMLQAVNEMLFSIGERPVNTLESGLPDAEQAETILSNENQRIQLKGWGCNTLKDFVLTLNADNQFVLPVNTLKVQTTNPRGARKQTNPPPSGYIQAVMRRSTDKTKFILYDVGNNSETWTDIERLTVDIVQLIPFDELVPSLQQYVWTSAAHRFQKGTVSSTALKVFTEEDVEEAREQAVQEETDTENFNILTDNPHVYSVVYRNNRIWGR